jgi:HEAT repeat protein
MNRSLFLVALILLVPPCAAAASVRVLSPGGPVFAAADPDGESDLYREGRRALDDSRWDDAIDRFGRLASEGGEEADAALFWKAYAEHKAGRKGEALASLKRLAAEHAGSAWLDDAKALELEVRGGGGRVPADGSAEDEELKLYALDGLMQMDSERAVPLLLKFLAGDHSRALKEKALFVLSQSDSPRATSAVLEVARGSRHPDLQLKAVEMLGVSGDEHAVGALKELYATSTEPRLRAAVLQAYLVADEAAPLVAVATGDGDERLRGQAIHLLGAMGAETELRALLGSAASPELRIEVLEAMGVAGDDEGLLKVAREERDPQVRRRAIEGLGVAGADEALRTLLRSEASAEVRVAVLEAMGVAGDVEGLAQAARQERDPEVQRRAIQGLGVAGGEEAQDTLAALYRATSDREVKSAVIEALFVNGGAQALIDIFRQEKDRELKREALQKLSMMDDDEASSLLMEILEKE